MKFLFIAPRLHPNFLYQIKALQAHGHEVDFFALYTLPPGEDDNIIKPAILGYSKLFLLVNKFFNKKTINRTKSHFELKYGFPPIVELFALIKKAKAQVIFIKNIECAYSLLAMMAGLIFRMKIVIFLSIEKYRGKKISKSVFWVGKLFNAVVITPLEGNSDKYVNDNDNLFYVPFPVLGHDIEKEHFKNNKINIVCVGKFQKRKEQLLLIKAISKLNKKYHLYLNLVGIEDEKDYFQRLKECIARRGLSSKVAFKLNIPWKDMWKIYRDNDLFVLPSYNEIHSYAALEAMYYYLPVIVSDNNGIKWYIKSGINGYVFKKSDLDDLIEKIELIINNKNNIIKMGKASHKIALNNFSLENYYQSLSKALNIKVKS